MDLISVAVASGVGFVLLIGFALTVARFYRQVDQGKVLIVNNLKAEPKVSFTGAVVLPIIHRAQVMDISLKRVEIDRRGKDGLICADNIRADIKVTFFVRVLSSFEGAVPKPNTGTLVCDEEQIVEKQVVSGVAYSRDEAKFTLIGVEDHPGVAATIFGALADAGVNVDMIVQATAKTEGRQNMVFTAPDRDAPHAQAVIEKLRDKVGFESLHVARDVAKVSVIGVGMRSHAGVAKTMFEALAAKGINIQVISTSEIKISVLIDASYTELAVRALHTAYGLDAD
jgi:predicted amino acid-binding ACT domain protein